MTILKYIRFTNDFFLIFPGETGFPTHEQIADPMKFNAGMATLSAGQIMIDGGEIVCNGESVTLKVKSLFEQDEEFFKPRIFLPGVSKPAKEAD